MDKLFIVVAMALLLAGCFPESCTCMNDTCSVKIHDTDVSLYVGRGVKLPVDIGTFRTDWVCE